MKFLFGLVLCFTAAQAGLVHVSNAAPYASSYPYSAPVASVYSSGLSYAGYPTAYSTLGAPLVRPYAVPSVYAAPSVYGAPSVYAAPSVYGAPAVYAAPSVYGAPSVYAAPTGYAGPTVYGFPSVYAAPSVFSPLRKK